MAATKADAFAREYRANQEIIRVLEASKALSETIVDELPTVMMMIDDQRRVLKLNREGQKLFARQESDVLGLDASEVLPKAAAERVSDYFGRSAFETNERLVFEDQFNVDNETKYYHWQLCPVYSDASSSRQVMVLIGNDTSAARQALERFVELRKDLEVASAVQTMLLPPSRTREGRFFRMAGHYEPSTQVGGDLWWYLVVPGRGLLSIVADAMGHGAGSALAAATTAGALHALAHHHDLSSGGDIVRMIRDLNRTISVTYQDRYMVSLGTIWLNEDKPTVEISAAGFPAALLQPKGAKPISLVGRGDPLGLGISSFELQNREFPMNPGDRIVVFTDGCYEFDFHGEHFRRRRLIEVFERFRDLPPVEACEAVSEVLKQARGKDFADDDMTYVIIDRLDPG